MTKEKMESLFPLKCRVMYSNHGRRGHGNIATVCTFLCPVDDIERRSISAVQLSFDSGGNHYVSVNQLKKYYSRID